MKKYSFTLLTELKDNKLIAPMSPMMAANHLATSLNEKLFAIYRINFTGHLYQVFENGEGWTGYDHLAICFHQWVVVCIDRGIELQIILAAFDGGEIDLTGYNLSDDYNEKLTEEELTELGHDIYTVAMKYRTEFINLTKQLALITDK